MSAPPPLHELEAEIMEEAWTREACTVREILGALNARTPTPRAQRSFSPNSWLEGATDLEHGQFASFAGSGVE